MKRVLNVLCVLCMFFMVSGCAFVTVPLLPTAQPLKEQVIQGKGSAKILIMDITGFISEKQKESMLGTVTPSMVVQVREILQQAEKDSSIAGVLIRINSPGGTITASDIIHHEISGFKARKKIPVHACIMSLGTSGGYYIAAATDRIIAHPTSLTGSVAVIMMSFNVEGLMGKIGVTEQIVKTGDKKDMMSPFRPATPEEKKIVQDIINQYHKRFVDIILARPGNTLNRKEMETLADGRVYTADQALAAKLVDRIGYIDDVITGLKKEMGVEDARIVTYDRPGGYKGTIYSSSSAEPARIMSLLDGGVGSDWFGESQFMYLWRP